MSLQLIGERRCVQWFDPRDLRDFHGALLVCGVELRSAVAALRQVADSAEVVRAPCDLSDPA
jgi:hypothetical protein